MVSVFVLQTTIIKGVWFSVYPSLLSIHICSIYSNIVFRISEVISVCSVDVYIVVA